MATPIYLDNNASTRTDPRVVEAMLPYLTEHYGNAASAGHVFGRRATEAIEDARARVAALLGAEPPEIVFTSGATEADNLALRGVVAAHRHKGRHIVTSTIEHKAILDTASQLEADGVEVTYVPVDAQGRVNVDNVAAAVRPDTVLVSIMLANNEIGTLQEVEKIGAMCHERGVLFHTDATQAIGKVFVNVKAMNIDLMSLTGHKMHGPKGAGALYASSRAPRVVIMPQMTGGGHENGHRSGTLNTPAVVGFGKAAEISMREFDADVARMRTMRNRLERVLMAIEGAHLNGHSTLRLPHTLNLRFDDVEAAAVIAAVPDIAISAGSACSTAMCTASHVLKAIGLSDRQASCSLRFATSRFTTEDEIDYAASRIAKAVCALRTAVSGFFVL